MNRPYEQIAAQLVVSGDREQRMQAVVDALWEALHELGVSWVGFYLADFGESAVETPAPQLWCGRPARTGAGGTPALQMVCGPRRDKPACSPIGLHGVCGQAFLQRQTRIVADVRELGPNYVACDPRDRSEVVVPLFEPDGRCWGVIDLDSHAVGAFSDADAAGLLLVLRNAELTV